MSMFAMASIIFVFLRTPIKTCRQKDHRRRQGGSRVVGNGFCLGLGAFKVDGKGKGKANHEGSIKRNLRQAHKQDDTDRNKGIDPDKFGALHAVRLSVAAIIGIKIFCKFSRFARRVDAGAARLFKHAQVSRKSKNQDNAKTL